MSERMRIDKWLWAARFYKTRGLAADELGLGRVSVNGIEAKASKEIRVGDRLEIRHAGGLRVIDVLALSALRGPAPVAQQLYAETPESQAARAAQAEQRRLAREPGLDYTQGRPTKRDRRELERQRGARWDDRWSASID
jgi:ribosome-associated heat shock protein Hsp15